MQNRLEKPVLNSERSSAKHGLAIGSGAASSPWARPWTVRLVCLSAPKLLMTMPTLPTKPLPDVETSNDAASELMSQLRVHLWPLHLHETLE